MKLLEKSKLSNCEANLTTNKEINIMLSYDSSFITRLFGFAEDKNYIYILMEFVPCSDMLKLLKLVTRIPEYHAKYVIA